MCRAVGPFENNDRGRTSGTRSWITDHNALKDRRSCPCKFSTKVSFSLGQSGGLRPIVGGGAALLLIAGTAIGVQASNVETTQRCAAASSAVQSAAAAAATAVDKANKAQGLAAGTTGYDKTNGAAPLLTGLDKAKQDLGYPASSTGCTTSDQAAALVFSIETAAAKAAALDEATIKLSQHVTDLSSVCQR